MQNTQNLEIPYLEKLYLELIKEFDGDPIREDLIDTPHRAAAAMRELLTPVDFVMTLFDAQGYSQMIVDREIPFFSLCEHHLLPFFGTVTIGYIPNKKIIGLSKLSRCVEYNSRRLNTQEYLTQNIANQIETALAPQGLGVIIKARHLCREMRGARCRGEMITSCLKGIFLKDPAVREEFMKL